MPHRKYPKILIASNSQASSSGLVSNANYPSLLRTSFNDHCDVQSLLVSGWTILDFYQNLIDNVIPNEPDLVILHFGIVESAQRILSTNEKKLLSLVPFGSKVTSFLHNNRSLVLRIRRYFRVSTRVMRLDHFSTAVQNVVQCLEDNKIDYLFVLTPLLPNNGEAISHPFINQDLLSYNQVMSKYRSVDLNSSDIKWIMSDYQDGTVHFTEQGHQKIHASLMPFISQSLQRHKR